MSQPLPPVALPHETRACWLVPCPYCGERETHRGTCELSMMRTGRVIVVFAADVAEQRAVPA